MNVNNLAIIAIISLFQAIFLLIGYYLGKHNTTQGYNNVHIKPNEKKTMFNRIINKMKTPDAGVTSPSKRQQDNDFINTIANDEL